MIIPNKIKKGDTIGVVAPSNPIIGDNIEEIKRAKEIVEADGFKVKFSKNLFSNTNGYTGTAKEKAEDINNMFADKEIKMIWCAKGGNNSNSTFEYLDFETIKNNPKIICGYSDITSMLDFASEFNIQDSRKYESRDKLIGFCLLIKREVINKVGLLDEQFFPGNFEDDDYCMRILEAKYKLVLSKDTFIHHFGNISFKNNDLDYKKILRKNKEKFKNEIIDIINKSSTI